LILNGKKCAKETGRFLVTMFTLAIENLYFDGKKVNDYLCTHWQRWQ